MRTDDRWIQATRVPEAGPLAMISIRVSAILWIEEDLFKRGETWDDACRVYFGTTDYVKIVGSRAELQKLIDDNPVEPVEPPLPMTTKDMVVPEFQVARDSKIARLVFLGRKMQDRTETRAEAEEFFNLRDDLELSTQKTIEIVKRGHE